MEFLLELLLFPVLDVAAWVTSGMNRDEPAPRLKRGRCAYCRRIGSGLVKCAACRAPHHRDCAEVSGRCAIYGCGHRSFRVPA